MEKNNSSNPSMCRKVRQAFTGTPAVKAIQRVSSYYQKPKHVTIGSNSPSPSPTNTATQIKPPLPQHPKVNTEGAGAIPIKFGYSTPTSMDNGGLAVPSAHSQAENFGAFKGEDKGKPKAETPAGPSGRQHDHGLYSEQQGKKSVDIGDRFTDYIEITKKKFRTTSNIGREQTNPAPDHESTGTNKKENHKDFFSNFIQLTKKKMRTTSNIGKTISMKRGRD